MTSQSGARTRSGPGWRMILPCVLAGLGMTVVSSSRVYAGDGPNNLASPAKEYPGGFVFLNGQYIVAPYVVQASGSTLQINTYRIDQDCLDLSGYPGSEPLLDVHFVSKRKARAGSVAIRELASDILFAVGSRDVVVLSDHCPPIFLDGRHEGADFLEAVLKGDQNRQHAALVSARTVNANGEPAGPDVNVALNPPPEFIAHATEHLARLRVADRKNDSIVAASVWTDRLGYPLTIFAMVVVVLAFGHLMSNKPRIEMSCEANADCSLQARQVVMRSLLIVAMLSLVDLAWTILASQTGAMRELNPLGRYWIEDPTQLVLFKLTVVSTAIGVLYWLHQRPIAQVASWWSCLVLTLVTARWLTFNSMFL